MATSTPSSTSLPPVPSGGPAESSSSNGASTSHSTASSSISAPRPPLDLPMPSSSPSLVEGVRSIHPQDLLHVHEMPCARTALLFGLAAGFGIGGLHFVLRGAGSSSRSLGFPSPSAASWRSMNYFVAAWALGSVGSFKFCQRQRELERKGIGRAVEIMERKKREKEAEAREMREALRRRRQEEAARAEEERRRSWWGLGRWILPAAGVNVIPPSPPPPSSPASKQAGDGTSQGAGSANAISKAQSENNS